MSRVFLLILFMLMPAVADEVDIPSNNLGMTRAAFMESFAKKYPDLELPVFECEKPILIRKCKTQKWNDVSLFAADTYTRESRAQVFHAGAPGLLYEVGVMGVLNEGDVARKTFGSYCAAFFEHANPDWDLNGAVNRLTRLITEATLDEFGNAYFVDPSGIYVLQLRNGRSGLCMVAGEHILFDGRNITPEDHHLGQ